MNSSGEASEKTFRPEAIQRLVTYHHRHGFRATVERSAQLLRRSLSANRMVLFYFDFADYHRLPSLESLPGHLVVERKECAEDMDEQSKRKIINFWNADLCQRNLSERFREGASLWLIRSGGKVAGYGWTMTGHTIAPHFCPLGANDVHFFDFLVFPEFLGQQINPSLVNHMLAQFAAEGRTRAYIEVAEWNQQQLSSLRRTHFRLFGVARKASVLGRTFVEWVRLPQEEQSKIILAEIRDTKTKHHERLVSH